MRKAVTAAVSAIVISTTLGATPATAGSLGRFEVTGVGEDDMLKMRAGPGTGVIVLLGLPNGTILQVHDC
ncbi:MAG TPA: peptide-binding protein, partial [Sulfitobacter sp.]|nr:peptide-binding protein [Sulfitobacter sp.]